MLNYRKRIYANYIENIFSDVHDAGAIEKEYVMYDRYFARNYQQHLPANKDASILDVGCGMGHFLHYLTQAGYKNATGVDGSPDIAAFCKKQGLTVTEGDLVEYVAANPGRYDCIVMNDVIEHFKKEEIVVMLDAVRAALKPGGTFIIKTDNMANGFVAASGRYFDFTHEIGFTEVSLRQILKACGFKDVLVKGTDIYVLYGNPLNYPAKFAAWLFSGFHFLVCWLYGRRTIKVFDKDLLAVAHA